MSFNLRVEQVSGRQVPLRALSFACSGQWTGNDAFLVNLDGRLLFGNRVVSEPVRVSRIHWSQGSRARLWGGQQLGIELVAILSDSAIQFVEDSRGTADISFSLEFQYQWHEAEKRDRDVYTSGALHWEQGAAQFPAIARSRWLQLLGEMQWTEIEVFELRTTPFTHFEHLATATARMRDAEAAFRNGDWNGVLFHCRAALEGAAKSQARSDNLKQGFDLLFASAVPEHSEKRKVLDAFVTDLSDYAHFGRHEKFPALQITRSEAEFVYTTTLGLFSFLGRRLSKLETLPE
jgi:hypothetical protein